MAESNQTAETTVSDVHKKIKAVFEAFDYESNNTVDVRTSGAILLVNVVGYISNLKSSHQIVGEIGTIIYSLGCFPTQADIHDFIAEVEEDHSGFIHLDRFLPSMTKVLLEHKFPPIAENRLLEAFEVLDKEKKGYLECEELTKYMTQEGEPFTQEEMDEMLTALADHEKNRIYYYDVISQLTIDPDK